MTGAVEIDAGDEVEWTREEMSTAVDAGKTPVEAFERRWRELFAHYQLQRDMGLAPYSPDPVLRDRAKDQAKIEIDEADPTLSPAPHKQDMKWRRAFSMRRKGIYEHNLRLVSQGVLPHKSEADLWDEAGDQARRDCEHGILIE